MNELISKLASPDPEERQEAVYELGETQNPEAISHLISALQDEDLYVRVFAIQALGEFKDSSIIKPMCELLSVDLPHRLIVSNVCAVLGSLGDSRAIPCLERLLESDQPFSRYDAAYALGEIGDPSAIPALEKLVTDDTMPEFESEDGDFEDTLYSVGEQAARAIKLIRS